MYIDDFDEFLLHLREILKDEEPLLINSLLGNCLNDFKYEQKYIASRIVVFPTLF